MCCLIAKRPVKNPKVDEETPKQKENVLTATENATNPRTQNFGAFERVEMRQEVPVQQQLPQFPGGSAPELRHAPAQNGAGHPRSRAGGVCLEAGPAKCGGTSQTNAEEFLWLKKPALSKTAEYYVPTRATHDHCILFAHWQLKRVPVLNVPVERERS